MAIYPTFKLFVLIVNKLIKPTILTRNLKTKLKKKNNFLKPIWETKRKFCHLSASGTWSEPRSSGRTSRPRPRLRNRRDRHSLLENDNNEKVLVKPQSSTNTLSATVFNLFLYTDKLVWTLLKSWFGLLKFILFCIVKVNWPNILSII